MNEDQRLSQKICLKISRFISRTNWDQIFEKGTNKEIPSINALSLSLGILGDVTALDTSREFQKSLRNTKIIPNLLKILQLADKYKVEIPYFEEENDEYIQKSGLKSFLLRILGNIAFRNTENQNEIRENGGIEQFLNHCHIEDGENDPCMREWAILGLRNITENNTQNQEFIEHLKYHDVQKNKHFQFQFK